LAQAFDNATRRELLPPCLVVFPNGLPNGMWCDAVGGARVETLVRDGTLPANRELQAHLQELGIPHDSTELAAVKHDPMRLLQARGDGFWQCHREVFAPGKRW
jgi:hypothetical protein